MKREKKTIGINETLLELITGIILSALLFQISIVWFVTDKASYSTGLWCGALMAVIAAWHMYHVLDTALDCDGGSAGKAIQKGSVWRYLVFVLVFAFVMWTKITNPLSMFLGLMGLKVAAYIQPFTHKLLCRFRNEKKELE